VRELTSIPFLICALLAGSALEAHGTKTAGKAGRGPIFKVETSIPVHFRRIPESRVGPLHHPRRWRIWL
jgi:hypothetical protein